MHVYKLRRGGEDRERVMSDVLRVSDVLDLEDGRFRVVSIEPGMGFTRPRSTSSRSITNRPVLHRTPLQRGRGSGMSLRDSRGSHPGMWSAASRGG
jgi:hypothetical protein